MFAAAAETPASFSLPAGQGTKDSVSLMGTHTEDTAHPAGDEDMTGILRVVAAVSPDSVNPRTWRRFRARMPPNLHIIVGPPSSTTSISASIAACHSGAAALSSEAPLCSRHRLGGR